MKHGHAAYMTPPVLAQAMARWAVRQSVAGRADMECGPGFREELADLTDSDKARMLGVLGTTRVLDPCCGSGSLLLAAAGEIRELEMVCHVPGPVRQSWSRPEFYGIDIDEGAIEAARGAMAVEFPGWRFDGRSGNALFGLLPGDGTEMPLHETMLERVKEMGLGVEKPVIGAGGLTERTRVSIPEMADIEGLKPFDWRTTPACDVILCNPPWDAWRPEAREFFRERGRDVAGMSAPAFSAYRRVALQDADLAAEYAGYIGSFSLMGGWLREAEGIREEDPDARRVAANTAAVFTRLCRRLAGTGTCLSLLLPGTMPTDLSWRGVRDGMLEQDRVHGLFSSFNDGLFDDVDPQVRYTLAFIECSAPPAPFAVLSGRGNLDRLETFPWEGHVTLSPDDVRRLYPRTRAIPHLADDGELGTLTGYGRFPTAGPAERARRKSGPKPADAPEEGATTRQERV